MTPLRTLTALVAPARRNIVWLLIGVYALAAFLPATGNQLRGLSLGALPFSSGTFNPAHLLLGVLLVCVGLTIAPGQTRSLRRLFRWVSFGLAASWLLPFVALGVLAACHQWLGFGSAGAAFLMGAVLVTAMPPANSASAWSDLSGGQAAMVLWVIILGTLVSPLVTPLIIGLLGSAIVSPDLRSAESSANLLEVLFAFVVLPAALGVVLRGLLEATRPQWTGAILELSRLTSLIALLLLNYVNAAAVMPQVISTQAIAMATGVVSLTVVLCGLVFGLGLFISQWWSGGTPGDRLSFVYVVSMKNTGAALVLASTLLDQYPLALLVPVLYTLSQHFAAALLDRWMANSRPLRVEEARNEENLSIDETDIGPMLASRG